MGLIVTIVVAGLGIALWRSPLIQRGNIFDDKSSHPSLEELKDGNCRQINESNPGERIEISKHKVRGHYTIFDFYSEGCGFCVSIAPQLVELTKQRPDIAVRSIDVDRPGSAGIDWGSPVCPQYNIHTPPHFIIVDEHGKTIVEGRPAAEQIMSLIHKAD